jgi:hypothetical protein
MADPQGDTLLVRCKCGNPMRVSRQFVGREMTCYACGKTFVVGGVRPQPPDGIASDKAMVPSPLSQESPPPARKVRSSRWCTSSSPPPRLRRRRR